MSTADAPSEICDELPAVIAPSSLKAGLSLASVSVVVPSRMPSSWREHLGGAVDLDVDLDDLVLEAALVASDGGALLALGAERVEVVTGQAVLLGDHLGADALRRQAGLGVAVELRLREREAHAGDDRGTHRGAGHDLDTGGDDDVVRAGDDALRAEVHRLLARTALAVDGGRRDRLGPTGGEHGVAADVERLLTDLHDAAHDDVVDHFGVEAVALLERLEGFGSEGGGVPVLELSVALSAGGADGVDDDGFGHDSLLLFVGSVVEVVGGVDVAGRAGRDCAMAVCRFCWRRVITQARAWRSSRPMPRRSSARSTASTSPICVARSLPSAVIATSHTRRSAGLG